jgi:long-chain acyl-CoA synthetase
MNGSATALSESRQLPWLAAYPANTPAEIDPDAFESLVAVFEASCMRFADRPAFANLGRSITYRELDQLSRDFAGYLASLGLAHGDRVALMMPNILQYPIALFGALRAGMTVVNTNPLYTPRELRHQLSDSGATTIVILENFAHVLERVVAETSIRHVVVTAVGDALASPKRALVNFVVRRVKRTVPAYRLNGAVSWRAAMHIGRDRGFARPTITGSDVAFLQYTGGTTGVAKGAILTHRNLVANLQQVAALWQSIISPGREVVITALPLYHIFCLTCNCLVFMQHGGLNVLVTNPRDMPAFLEELSRWRFTVITGVNTLFATLLDQPRFRQLDFGALKLAVAGGMALHPSVATRWRAATGKSLVEGYGLTEASPVVTANPPGGERIGTIGVPVPSTEVVIRDGDRDLPPGESGELCVRGPQVMRGYWNMPEETRATLDADGWLRTGDIATVDADGYVRIVDRKKDMIIVSGFKVFPNEIEAVLTAHDAVLEVGCVGVPDEKSGQAVKTFIVTRAQSSVTIESLQEYCRANLTPYKVPKYFEFRESLPKTNVGKILRRALLEPPQSPNH